MTTSPVRAKLLAVAIAAGLAVAPAFLGTSQASAYAGSPSTELQEGIYEVSETPPVLAPSPSESYGYEDALMQNRPGIPEPKGCTYADKSYSTGSIVKMDGGELRECQDGKWVPYTKQNKS